MAFLAYIFGFLAAVANAAANTLQRAANRDESADRQFSFQLVRDLIKKPIWLAGIGAITCSFFLQAAGLGVGTLAAIEPLVVLELPLTLIAAAWFLGGRLGRREWSAIVGMSVGTIALIAFLDPKGGRTGGIPWWVWFVAIACTASIVVVCYWLGHRWQEQARRAAVMGVGTGASYGLAAALVKGMTVQFGSGGIVGVLASWELYGAVVAGVFAIWMHQNAVGAGRLAVAQPGVTLTDPYLSIVWGAAVFHESMRGGLWVLPTLAAAALMTASVVVLARSPQLAGASGEREQGDEGDGGDGGENGRDDVSVRRQADAP